MKRHTITYLSLALLSAPVFAEAPWGKVDLKHAPELHQKACAACHVRMYGGDGSRIYTKPSRVLSDKLELLQRVSACASQHHAGWFPDEEGSVAAWLNREYYHFQQ